MTYSLPLLVARLYLLWDFRDLGVEVVRVPAAPTTFSHTVLYRLDVSLIAAGTLFITLGAESTATETALQAPALDHLSTEETLASFGLAVLGPGRPIFGVTDFPMAFVIGL